MLLELLNESITFSRFLGCSALISAHCGGIVMIFMLKLLHQITAFSMLDHGLFFIYNFVSVLYTTNEFVHVKERSLKTLRHCYNLNRTVLAASIVLEIQGIANTFLNRDDLLYYLEIDSSLGWKFVLLTLFSIVRLVSAIWLLKEVVDQHHHETGEKVCRDTPTAVFFTDVAMIEFFFLYISKNDLDLLSVWFASVVSYFYYKTSREIYVDDN